PRGYFRIKENLLSFFSFLSYDALQTLTHTHTHTPEGGVDAGKGTASCVHNICQPLLLPSSYATSTRLGRVMPMLSYPMHRQSKAKPRYVFLRDTVEG
ncbi:hypothetical protein, partial [Salmonella sp. s39606]|uniref:hypothetical protein n=1 Tax=Salmonella sp. s39606 TaxID=3159643 RepID=UPI00397F1F94